MDRNCQKNMCRGPVFIVNKQLIGHKPFSNGHNYLSIHSPQHASAVMTHIKNQLASPELKLSSNGSGYRGGWRREPEWVRKMAFWRKSPGEHCKLLYSWQRILQLGAAIIILTFGNSYLLAQLAIDNPRHLDVPVDQARILLEMSCQAVAKELRLPQATKVEFPLHLVIGPEDEHFGLDQKTGTPTLVLREWDAVKFTTAALRFAIQRSVDPARQEHMVAEVLRRAERVAPVPAAQLHGSVVMTTRQLQHENGCLDGITDAGLREPACDAIQENRKATAK